MKNKLCLLAIGLVGCVAACLPDPFINVPVLDKGTDSSFNRAASAVPCEEMANFTPVIIDCTKLSDPENFEFLCRNPVFTAGYFGTTEMPGAPRCHMTCVPNPMSGPVEGDVRYNLAADKAPEGRFYFLLERQEPVDAQADSTIRPVFYECS